MLGSAARAIAFHLTLHGLQSVAHTLPAEPQPLFLSLIPMPHLSEMVPGIPCRYHSGSLVDLCLRM